MVSIQRWDLTDIWDYSRVNIDKWTESYSIPFYLYYTIQWPQMHWTIRNNEENIIGYILGSANTSKTSYEHGHVTAVTVCNDYRRLGLASLLMNLLERTSSDLYNAYFVDLFVRPSNEHAQSMYQKLGYNVYRRIINYYSTLHEDGLDMRKSMPRDTEKLTMIPLDAPVSNEDVD